MKKTIIIMASICLALFTPINVSAQAYEIMSANAVPDGYCHCGYPREKTQIFMVQIEICPKHGPSCVLYHSTRSAWYYYCTNKNCGDDYQDQWSNPEYNHEPMK